MRELAEDVQGACACYKMREVSRRITRIYDEVLKPVGLRSTQFTMLSVSALNAEISLTELAEKQGLERTTLLRNLQPLEKKGLINISSLGTRHARYVSLTSAGVEVMEQAVPLWRQAQASLKLKLGNDIWDRIHQELSEVKQLV